MSTYKSMLKAFSRFGLRYFRGYFEPLKEEIIKSNLNILFELYVGRMLFISTVAFIALFLGTVTYLMLIGIPFVLSLISGLILGSTVLIGIITIYHSYPFQIISSKKGSIESNMPFAINHMSAIAGSGVPPFIIFKIMSTVPEYGEITHETERITRNVEVFGMDIVTSIKNVSERTPSNDFRQFLSGIVASIETGGDLRLYLENSARESMFDYRLKREKFLQQLSTYADFYTAVLIAAPLFFISILSVMALIGGSVLGMSIPVAMRLGIYLLIPLLNTVFVLFIHFTQPNI